MLSIGGKCYYTPTPKQALMHTSTSRNSLYGGARGGGKSYGLLHEALITAWETPRCTVLILMKTFARLETTFLTDLQKLDPEVYGGDPSAYNRGRHILTLPNGSQIIFRSCANTRDAGQFQGSQFILIIVDEANQFEYPVFEALQAVCRSPFRTAVNGQVVRPRIILGSNPGGIGAAWLKALFINKQPLSWMGLTDYDPADYEYIPAKVTDNPYIADDPDYIKMLNSLNPVLKAQWLDGSWDALAGVYFDVFEPRRSVISADEALQILETQKWQPRWAAMDWGFKHLCPFLFASKVLLYDLHGNKKEHVLIYRERAVKEIGDEAIGQELIRANGGVKLDRIYASPEIFGDDKTRNSRAKVISDQLVLGKLPRLSRADNSRIDGWSLMRDMLGGDGDRSRLLISDECSDLIESIPQLLCDPKRPEDVLKTSMDSDDWADTCRMLLKSHLAPREKPEETLKAEAMAPFIASGNLTQAYLASLRFDDEQKRKTTSFHPKRRRWR